MAKKQPLDCGSCMECCNLLAIPSIDKPARMWCSFARRPHGGCELHGELKPEACANFECLWLVSQKRENPFERLPLELRPNRSHVVMGPYDLEDNTKIYFQVDPAFADAWMKEPIASYIEGIRERGGTVEVIVGEERVVLESCVADTQTVLATP